MSLTFKDTLTPALIRARAAAAGALKEVAENYASQSESYAKENAPWEDQTTNARGGLFGEAEVDGNVVTVVVGHTAEYGPYLELGTHNDDGSERNRPFPILQPTVEEMAPKFFAAGAKVVNGLLK